MVASTTVYGLSRTAVCETHKREGHLKPIVMALSVQKLYLLFCELYLSLQVGYS